VLVTLGQTQLIFLPTRELRTTPRALGLAYEDVTIATTDGEQLHAWLVPYGKASPTVLFLHGNAGNIAETLLSLSCIAQSSVRRIWSCVLSRARQFHRQPDRLSD